MPVAAAPSGGSAGAAQAAAEAAEDAPPPAAEKSIFTVKLESFEAAAKAKIIREVKALLGCNLVEAKNMVEKAPTVLKENVVKDVSALFTIASNASGCKESERNDRETWSKDNFAIDYIYIHSEKKTPSTHIGPLTNVPIEDSFP